MSNSVLALDIGLKRTGVAISESGLIAQPLGVIEAKPPHMQAVVKAVLEYIEEYNVGTLVIGIPYSQEEHLTSQALKVEQIIGQIEKAVKDQASAKNVQIVRINEYHSTQDAKLLFPTTDPDAAAATIILQDFLDQRTGSY